MVSAVSAEVWIVTLVALLAIVFLDLAVIARRDHEVTIADATRWVVFYISLAAVFAVILYVADLGVSGSEFVAGYVTEYSLSVDNLFVFVIIMSRFSVPAMLQDKLLYIGIVVSMVLRTTFIAAGAAAVSAASWVFYIFGAFLIYSAYSLATSGDDDEIDFRENAALRGLRRVLPLTDGYDGNKIVSKSADGHRSLTPAFLVICAIGMANVVFALDSIPAIFGLTQDAFVVFTANAFALMGLRQLYFLIGGLLGRIIYLDVGLSIILGFIGVKLIIEALHGSSIDHVGSVPIPEIGIATSLGLIAAILAVTAVASLMKTGGAAEESAEGSAD